MRKLVDLVADDSGQDLIEYALVAGLIGLASVAALVPLAARLNNSFVAIRSAIHPNCPPRVSCISGH